LGGPDLDSIEAAYAVYKTRLPLGESVYPGFGDWNSLEDGHSKVVPQRLFNSYDYNTMPKYPERIVRMPLVLLDSGSQVTL
jgi:hypothetical protein